MLRQGGGARGGERGTGGAAAIATDKATQRKWAADFDMTAGQSAAADADAAAGKMPPPPVPPAARKSQ